VFGQERLEKTGHAPRYENQKKRTIREDGTIGRGGSEKLGQRNGSGRRRFGKMSGAGGIEGGPYVGDFPRKCNGEGSGL